jgi:hypothetical protein
MGLEDDFRRLPDPRARRNALVVAAVVVAALGALVGATLLTRGQPAPTASTGTSPSATAVPSSPPPTPVPAIAVLGSGFAAAYDAQSHQLVAFGGVDNGDQTWVWEGRRWRLARPSVVPPGRFGAALAYDPRAGVLLLFGGRLVPGQVVDDTWAWDGATWRLLDDGASASPPAGEGAVMAWDATTEQMVLVTTGADPGAQTWTWNGSRWDHRAGGDPPAGTYLIGMTVDPVSQRLVGVSCCTTGAGDASTLAWDGAAWHALTTSSTMPGFTVGLVRDPVSDRLLLFADPSIAAEVWSWSGRQWSIVPNATVPVFPAASMIDTDTHRVVIVGSVAEPVQGTPQPVQVWTLDGGTAWRRLG